MEWPMRVIFLINEKIILHRILCDINRGSIYHLDILPEKLIHILFNMDKT